MQHSEGLKEIAGAMLKAQIAIKAALKDSTNPHFKSKYADLSSVIDAVKSSLNANGIVFTQAVSGSENGIAVETMLIHAPSGEWMSESLPIPVVKNDAQGVGSAITYGRRYGLQSMCGVPAEDDDGNAATKAAPTGTITPTTGVLQSLPAERQKVIMDTAVQVKDSIAEDRPMDAYALCETSNFDAEEKIALWSLLDSKQRSMLKRLSEAERGVVKSKATRKDTEHNLLASQG